MTSVSASKTAPGKTTKPARAAGSAKPVRAAASAKPEPKLSRGDVRRREVLDAALTSFLELGVEATTLEHIRARSGASTGSIYHLFKSKDALAGAIFLESLADLHARLLEAIGAASSAREAILAVVDHYLDWVVREPERARFLLHAPRAPIEAAVGPELLAENRAFLLAMKQHVTEHMRGAQVRQMPMDVFVVLVLAPMQEYARQHLGGIAKTPPDQAARALGEAVWRAVRADP